MDKSAFMLGMVTAFCECVAADAKPLALSPPMSGTEFSELGPKMLSLVQAHGLSAYHEENLDLPPSERHHWIILYRSPTALDAYLALRAEGKSPARDLDAFAKVLGYGPERAHTGYDALHALFPES